MGNGKREGASRGEVGSGAGFILDVGLVGAWREISRGSDARQGGSRPITTCGNPGFLRGNHRHANNYNYPFPAS